MRSLTVRLPDQLVTEIEAESRERLQRGAGPPLNSFLRLNIVADLIGSVDAMLSRRSVIGGFNLDENVEAVVAFLQKYASVPMSFADACLVRMSETAADAVILTTDTDFRIYRRHSRQVVPCIVPR